ncbi:MAG TPA: fatty acyl-AMP ligase [Chloroflexota bacterium]
MTGLTHAPIAAGTLVDLAQSRAADFADRRAYTFLIGGEEDEAHLTYGELDRQARAIAAELQRRKLTGAHVLLLYPPGLAFVAGFFGCLYAGCVAVPAYPPQLNRATARIQGIATDAGTRLVLTDQSTLASRERALAEAPALADLEWLATDDLPVSASPAWHAPDLQADDLALLQYTSGSTGDPRGVMLSHKNLLTNLARIHSTFNIEADSTGVCWLPPYHDMGLIGGLLQPLYEAAPLVVMSPLAFLQRPIRWLQAIARYRGTTNGGPTFAYDLCVQRTRPEQRELLDLSHWRVAFVGAEPVRYETLRRFADAFEPAGFRWEAFAPCYGLAESTLLVSGGRRQPSVALDWPSRARDESAPPQPLVSCGVLDSSRRVVIVDAEHLREVQQGHVGEIWVQGADVARGYWNRGAETLATFGGYLADTGEGPFLRTGDLGFIKADNLFITGRIKELIIVDGRNHSPHDIELTVEQAHPALEEGGCAAFSADVNGAERVVVAAELNRRFHRDLRDRPQDVAAIATEVKRAVSELHDLRLHSVVLLRQGQLPRTSSGKLQRNACRERFLAGTLENPDATPGD